LTRLANSKRESEQTGGDATRERDWELQRERVSRDTEWDCWEENWVLSVYYRTREKKMERVRWLIVKKLKIKNGQYSDVAAATQPYGGSSPAYLQPHKLSYYASSNLRVNGLLLFCAFSFFGEVA